MTSTFAEIVLGLFIPLSIATFFFMRPIPAALLIALGGEMFLPEGPAFRLPFCPQLGKHNLVYLCIVVGCLLKCPGKVTKLPKDRWVTILAVLSIVGGACTGLTNGDALIFGEAGAVVIPAMTVKDGLFVGISEFFPSCVAFYIGYALFRQREDVERLLVWLGVAGLIYSLFAIVEMRMSPQFHK